MDIRTEIAWAMINHIYCSDFAAIPKPEQMTDEYLLVGVANSGVLIASHIAFITGLPMLYYVPSEKHIKYTKHEIHWEDEKESLKKRKIILIIGTSVTGYAIQDAIGYLNEVFHGDEELRVESVLGIVNRDKDNEIINGLRENNTTVDFLLEDYPADWCGHSDDENPCPYGYRCRGHAE